MRSFDGSSNGLYAAILRSVLCLATPIDPKGGVPFSLRRLVSGTHVQKGEQGGVERSFKRLLFSLWEVSEASVSQFNMQESEIAPAGCLLRHVYPGRSTEALNSKPTTLESLQGYLEPWTLYDAKMCLRPCTFVKITYTFPNFANCCNLYMKHTWNPV